MARPGEDFALTQFHSMATSTRNAHAALAMRDKGQTPGRYDLEPAGQTNGGDLTFADLVDVINPLQHIPGVSTIYRELTGDEISPPARVAGGALFFGPLGLAAAAANVMAEAVTGKDIGEHVATLFSDDADVEVADAGGSADPVLQGGLSIDEWLKAPPPGAPASSLVDPAAIEDELPEPPDPDRHAKIDSGVPQTAPPVQSPAASGPGAPVSADPLTVTGEVPVEALPADILAALLGGSGMQPIQASGAAPDTGNDTASSKNNSDETASPLGIAQPAPTEDGGLAGLQPPLMPDAVAFNDPDAFGAVASDGGWFAQAMNDALARYDDGATLRREAQRVSVDVSP